MTAEEMLQAPFGVLPDVLRQWGKEQGDKAALILEDRQLSFAALDAMMDRVAASLQRDGVRNGEAVAACATTSLNYAAVWLGILRAGGVTTPLAPSSSPESLVTMIEDSGARLLFVDKAAWTELAPKAGALAVKVVALDGSDAGIPFESWLAPVGAKPEPVEISPEQGFNIIYSSGTTGAPKGIVQPHSQRWSHLQRGGYGRDAVTMISTPLYSNTTLVAFLGALGAGGTVVLMARFEALPFLELSERYRVTHAMLVPVQYRRIMEVPDFDRFDLSSFRMKFCTSAPFSAELKRDVVNRWPGGLVEFYGMTEGGVTFMLPAHERPDKIHTVGKPLPGHIVKLIDEEGRELPQGEVGEIVGHSRSMMAGYRNQPQKTREAEWISPEGLRFIRTGDVGRLDEDGYLVLMDRKKDMIISGGFNIYPSDIEAELAKHPDVAEAAVIAAPSDRWGETPVGFVALNAGSSLTAEGLKAWVNGRVGKTQRLADLKLVDALPRSHIGKVLKRDLREAYLQLAPQGVN